MTDVQKKDSQGFHSCPLTREILMFIGYIAKEIALDPNGRKTVCFKF